MELNKDTIITLENQERYIIKNITFYGGVKYALAVKENANDSIIFEEVLEDTELFIKKVTDEELINILTRILEN